MMQRSMMYIRFYQLNGNKGTNDQLDNWGGYVMIHNLKK